MSNKRQEKEEIKESLNLRQEKFCQLYATSKEFFGNGVESYLEVYDVDRNKPNWYSIACASASRLLSNEKIVNRINAILEQTGFNDAFVDKELSFLITQHADFQTKLGAIKEYNKLKQRIQDKLDLTSKGEKIVNIVTYADPTSVQVQPTSLPAASSSGNGQWDKQSGDSVASA